MSRYLDKLFYTVENENFDDLYDKTKPIIPQIEQFAQKNNIVLEQGWKVFLAKHVKQQLQRKDTVLPEEYIEKWVNFFNKFNLVEPKEI